MPNWAIVDDSSQRVKQWVVSSPFDPVYPVNAGETAVKDPDISALVEVPLRYWKLSGGAIVEMAGPEKATVDAEIASANVASIRTGAKARLDGFYSDPLVLRALADIIKDEINMLRGWTVNFKAAVAASTNLANLQARVAALDTLNDRNLEQLKTAIKNRIDSGLAD